MTNPIGLCLDCTHVQVIRSDRGSTFYRCQLSDVDPRFPKYPRLPVATCLGYQAANSGEACNPADAD